jgi:hypothetical protein
MTPLGYPNQPPSQKSRKSLDQIICFEKYEWKGGQLKGLLLAIERLKTNLARQIIQRIR